jgi:hypothetical protein
MQSRCALPGLRTVVQAVALRAPYYYLGRDIGTNFLQPPSSKLQAKKFPEGRAQLVYYYRNNKGRTG